LAAPQENPFRRIHLPNLMRSTSAIVIAGRTSSRRRRRQLESPEPALQGSLAGTSAEVFLHQHADQTRAPTGMLLAQVHGFVKHGVVAGHRLGGATGIVRSHRLLSSIRKASHQMSHGALCESQLFGELGHGGAFLPPLKNRLPNGSRNRGRHRRILHDSVKIK